MLNKFKGFGKKNKEENVAEIDNTSVEIESMIKEEEKEVSSETLITFDSKEVSNSKLIIAVSIACVGALALAVFPPTSGKKALDNISAYRLQRQNYILATNSIKDVETQVLTVRNAISKTANINLDDINAVHTALTTLSGIKNIEINKVGINGDRFVPMGAYKHGESVTGIEGLQFKFTVDDVNTFASKLYGLNVPFESINIIPAENVVIVLINFKGGI